MLHTTTHSTNHDNQTEGGIGGIGPAATPGAHTSVIRSVSIRVAGPVTTEAFAHHFGTEAQQVGVRAGDTLTYVEHPEAAAVIARAFSDAVAEAERHELRHSVSPTWLGVEPGTYPPTLMQRHTTVPVTGVGFQPRRAISGTVVPSHVWVRVGPVLWQVCDRVAADRLAHVWSSCARMLTTPATASTPALTVAPRSAPQAPSRVGSRIEAPIRLPTQPSRPVSPAQATADARDDTELLAAYVAGDREALMVLVLRRTPLVAASARRVLGARGEVEDVVQEVWTNLARTADRFEGRAAVSTLLWRMARNSAVSVLRAQRPTLPLLDDTAGEAVAPGDAYAEADDVLTVRELLGVLPAVQRAAVELVDLQGHEFAAAARLLGVPEGTVKSRCARGREAMAVEAARRATHTRDQASDRTRDQASDRARDQASGRAGQPRLDR